MTFEEVLTQVREFLQRKGRVSYRALKLQFTLDDDYLAGLKDELIEAERVAVDEDGKVLVWVGEHAVVSSQHRVRKEKEVQVKGHQLLNPSPQLYLHATPSRRAHPRSRDSNRWRAQDDHGAVC